MATRLALQFNATTLAARNSEFEQIENHMRICIAVKEENETAVSIAASEPILAEAAEHIQHKLKVNLPEELRNLLQGPGLNKGDRGELVAVLLLTLARDKVVRSEGNNLRRDVGLLSFLEALLAPKWHDILDALPTHNGKDKTSKPLREAFSNARLHFNHFLKITDAKVINRDYLWLLVARGAAVLCANNQGGIDAVIPIVHDNTQKLGRKNVTGLVLQIKNDPRFAEKPKRFLFDAMDPYFICLFDAKDEAPPPIIRMVFALASPISNVKSFLPKSSSRPSLSRQAKPTPSKPKFTSYDLWCAKASTETFGVIEDNQDNVFADLLQLHRIFPRSYEPSVGEPKSVKDLRMCMHPGSGTDPNHWRFALTSNDDEED